MHLCTHHCCRTILQDDLLNGNLSVEETLTYTAQLRLDQSFTEEERQQRVNEVIKQMGLEKSRHTVVGTPLKKGISGGERKRLCVGMELLLHPALLFLDEPTSGLDSVAALGLVATLKELVYNWNCTVCQWSCAIEWFSHFFITKPHAPPTSHPGRLHHPSATEQDLQHV